MPRSALTALDTVQEAPEHDPAFLSQSLELAPDAVLAVDGENRIVLFNRAAERLWAVPREATLGEPLERLLPLLHDADGNAVAGSEIGQAADDTLTATLAHADGSPRMLSLRAIRVSTGIETLWVLFAREVTDQHLLQERLQQMLLMLDNSNSAIFVTGPDRSVAYVNGGFTRMFGYSRQTMIGQVPATLLAGPDTDPQLCERIGNAIARRESIQGEFLLYTRTRRPLWVSLAASPVVGEEGQVLGLVHVLTDITRTKMHQVMHEKVLNALVRDMPISDVMTLLCREVEHISPEVVISITGIDAENRMRPLAAPSLPGVLSTQMTGTAIGPRAGACGASAWHGRAMLIDDIATHPACEPCRHLLLPQGLRSSWSSPIKSSLGRVMGTVTLYYREPQEPNELHRSLIDSCLHLCTLTMEREQANERVHQLAFYDTLTGLPNRMMFSAKAEQALANAGRVNAQAAVLFVDLDRFKLINDAQGHSAGDGLLRDIAQRIDGEVQELHITGRQAGDEFVVVVPHCSAEQAGSLAERLLGAISAPASVGIMTLHPSASIGVAMYPGDGRDIELLVRHADMAMYRAKREGGGTFRFFSSDMNKVAQERVSLETALRDAIRLEQLRLEYQPQVSGCAQTHIHGVEALLRWQHPELGAIPPGRFIPVAEESGLISELSLWVLRQACVQMADWRHRGVPIPRISVNMSAINFRDRALAGLIGQTLSEHGLAADDLTLEITESVMLDPDPDVLGNIEAIYAMGVRLSLDDFGTGYSSLSHLHRLPIHELKLDQSFVRDIETSAIARTLTTSVLRIGDSLGMRVIAEGVESQAQQQFLAGQGCPILQGFLFSPPLCASALEHWLDRNQCQAATTA
ncbi:EAL domain-containing protein [Pseudoxanthomonas mexicana]|uniref:sensor domain-containing protein n=1 Tax=Pseudoxanthomonas mexicana TaxID=128785 RepID=UPI00398A549D